MHRLHVRRCEGGAEPQLTHRSDCSANTMSRSIKKCAKSQVLICWRLVVFVYCPGDGGACDSRDALGKPRGSAH